LAATRAHHDRWPAGRAAAGLRRGVVTALWATALLALGACGGATGGSLATSRPGGEGSPTERYVASLRLAALGRVEARGGLDEVAAEHFRAAYRKHPAVEYLLAAARSAERAKLYAEAHDALRQALLHVLPADERARTDQEVARLEPLVPPGLVRVTVQVAPEGARVELSRQQPGDPKEAGRSFDRVVLGTGWVFLQPGTWAVHSTAKGFQSELQTVTLQPDGAELVSVALHVEDTGPQLADPRPRAKRPDEALQPDGAKPQEPEGPVVQFNMDRTPKRSAAHTWGPIGLSVVGVAGIGAGGWFGFQAAQNGLAANDLISQKLPKAQYDTQLGEHVTKAQDNARLANYAFAGGGALVALGTLWWWLAPDDKPKDEVAPKLGTGPGGRAAIGGVAKRSGLPSIVRALRRPPAVALQPNGFGLHWSF